MNRTAAWRVRAAVCGGGVLLVFALFMAPAAEALDPHQVGEPAGFGPLFLHGDTFETLLWFAAPTQDATLDIAFYDAACSLVTKRTLDLAGSASDLLVASVEVPDTEIGAVLVTGTAGFQARAWVVSFDPPAVFEFPFLFPSEASTGEILWGGFASEMTDVFVEGFDGWTTLFWVSCPQLGSGKLGTALTALRDVPSGLLATSLQVTGFALDGTPLGSVSSFPCGCVTLETMSGFTAAFGEQLGSVTIRGKRGGSTADFVAFRTQLFIDPATGALSLFHDRPFKLSTP